MNQILEANLKLFFRRFPHYKKMWDDDDVRILDTAAFQLRGDGDSRSLLESGKLIDSCSLNFSAVVDSAHPGRILLMDGFGIGANIRRILDSPLKDFQNMFVVEPSKEAFMAAMKAMPLDVFLNDERIIFIVGASPDESFAEFMRYLRVPEIAFRMDASRFIHHPILTKKNEKYFEVVWDEWKAATKQIRRHFGMIEDSMVGFRYIVENIPWMEKTPGVSNLKDQFKGIPAIIASTGPSLNKSLPLLKELQNKVLIFAADASLSILLDHGITPHFAMTLERDNFCKKFFVKASKSHPKFKTNLVAFPVVPQESLKEYKAPQFVAYRDMGFFFFFEHSMPRGIISSSSSVAHFCLRMADYMGVSEVALVGQDLAFDPDHFQSHAEGVAYTEWGEKSSLENLKKKIETEKLGDLLWVEGNLKAQVPTHSTYFSFMKEFSWESTQVSMPVVNCTEGGAKIPEVAWKRLSDVSADWLETDDLFERIAALRDIPIGDLKPLKDIPKFLFEVSDKFKTILALTDDSQGLHQLPVDKKDQTLNALRAAQSDLYKDPRFVCFIVQNAGIELLEVENRWACLSSKSNFKDRLTILREWTEVCMNVASKLNEIFESSAFLKN